MNIKFNHNKSLVAIATFTTLLCLNSLQHYPVQASTAPSVNNITVNDNLFGTDGTCKWNYDSSSQTLIYAPETSNATLSSTEILKLNPQFKNVEHIIFTKPVNLASDSHNKFKNLTKLQSIQGLNKVDTSNVTNMQGLFEYDRSLTQLDLSNFNTARVTNMNAMFATMDQLTSLDVSTFDTKNVTNMDYLFEGEPQIKQLDLSNFNTSKVSSMSGMFARDTNLQDIDLRSFNTINVHHMDYMFSDLSKIASLNLANFNTANATDLSYMFLDDTNLASLDLSNFTTKRANKHEDGTLGMLANCGNPDGFILKLGRAKLKQVTFIGNNMTKVTTVGHGTILNPLGKTYSLKQFKKLTSHNNKKSAVYLMFRGARPHLTSLSPVAIDRQLKHNAYFYNKSGSAIPNIKLTSGATIGTYELTTINHRQFYDVGNGLYLAANNFGNHSTGNGHLLVNGHQVNLATLPADTNSPRIAIFKNHGSFKTATLVNKNKHSYYEIDSAHILPAKYLTSK
ncbi:BspA family leucine-rich repeat surface protein [Lactobacillus sp. ESL0731]|nr:BspA family leucine-rich repeat surface protein [Lactobacillus sp. ESL0731]WEV62206.1 BspA family leucine-rich repeat surface protein [Lactobacillus sp. ESL0731]